MVRYKEMYEWEKSAHQATEQELQSFKAMYAELHEKYLLQSKSFKSRGREVIKLSNDLVETTEHYEDMMYALEKLNIEKYVMLKESMRNGNTEK